jgi:protein-L-isoaspartate(D-aspartate) O-methyltransferase
MNRRGFLLLMIGFVLAGNSGWAIAEDDSEMRSARSQMVKEIEQDAMAASAPRIGRPRLDEKVMRVLGEVPRHEFVSKDKRWAAYLNRPLPIGYGQTISQPFIVALMTDLLAVSEDARILEVGSGSGYQAAVLSRLVKEVHSIEIITELAHECRERMIRLGYGNVTIHTGDGYYGLENKAPFDAIVVTAAATYIPPPLVRQLKPGGRMVIPVGAQFSVQYLMLIEKDDQGGISTRQILPVQFVPLTGKRE